MPSKPWPHDSHDKLVDAGYRHQATQLCNGPNCETNVLWYETPKGHMMPFERMADGRLQPHFASCRDVGKFTKAG